MDYGAKLGSQLCHLNEVIKHASTMGLCRLQRKVISAQVWGHIGIGHKASSGDAGRKECQFQRLKCLVGTCINGENKEEVGAWVTQAFWETWDQAEVALTQHIRGHELDTPVVVAVAPAPVPAPTTNNRIS